MHPLAARPSDKGFTLIEVILVVAMISVIVIPLLISYRTTRTNQALLSSTEEFANHVRSAHIFARDANGRKSWGVRSIDTKLYEIYSAIGGTSSAENRYSLEPAVQFTNSFDVLFHIGTGETDVELQVLFSADNGSKAKVEVLKTGVVEVVPI